MRVRYRETHHGEKAGEPFAPAFLPDAELACDVARVIHGVVEVPVAEHHEPQLVRRIHGLVVRVLRFEVAVLRDRRCGRGIHPCNLIVVYRLELVVFVARYSGGSILEGEAEEREPMCIVSRMVSEQRWRTYHSRSLSTRSSSVARIYIVPDALCPCHVPDI